MWYDKKTTKKGDYKDLEEIFNEDIIQNLDSKKTDLKVRYKELNGIFENDNLIEVEAIAWLKNHYMEFLYKPLNNSWKLVKMTKYLKAVGCITDDNYEMINSDNDQAIYKLTENILETLMKNYNNGSAKDYIEEYRNSDGYIEVWVNDQEELNELIEDIAYYTNNK